MLALGVAFCITALLAFVLWVWVLCRHLGVCSSPPPPPDIENASGSGSGHECGYEYHAIADDNVIQPVSTVHTLPPPQLYQHLLDEQPHHHYQSSELLIPPPATSVLLPEEFGLAIARKEKEDIHDADDTNTDKLLAFVEQHWTELMITVLLTLTAMATGIAWLVLTLGYTNDTAPLQLDFMATGRRWTPTKWRFNATTWLLQPPPAGCGLHPQDYSRIEWRCGDETPTVQGPWLPTMEHWYNETALVPDGSVGVNLTVELHATCSDGRTGIARRRITIGDGYPLVRFACDIVSSIRFAPVNASCNATASRGGRRCRGDMNECDGGDDSSASGGDDFVPLIRYEFNLADGRGWIDAGRRPFVDNVWLRDPGVYNVQVRLTDAQQLQRRRSQMLEVADGRPVAAIDTVYVNNSFHSFPTLVRLDASRTAVIYPGARLARLDWIVPPDDRVVTINVTSTGRRSFESVVWQAGAWTASVWAVDSTGRRSKEPAQGLVSISRPNPIAVLSLTQTHGGFTPTVLILKPDQSRINFPDSRILEYHWTSNVDGIDKAVTYAPAGSLTIPFTKPWPFSSPDCFATVTARDTRGLSSDKVRITFTIKDGTPRARFTAHDDVVWSTCRVAWYTYQAQDSQDPSGARLAKYKWFVNGRLTKTTSLNSWSDYYTRNVYSARSVHLQLVVTTDQGVDSVPFEMTLTVAPNYCDVPLNEERQEEK